MQNDQPFFTITTISFDEKHLETLLKAVDLMNVPTQKEHACLERTTLAISSTKIVVFEKWGSKMGQNMHMLMQYSVAFY
jgi:quinol monooxygenase YgiN